MALRIIASPPEFRSGAREVKTDQQTTRIVLPAYASLYNRD